MEKMDVSERRELLKADGAQSPETPRELDALRGLQGQCFHLWEEGRHPKSTGETLNCPSCALSHPRHFLRGRFIFPRDTTLTASPGLGGGGGWGSEEEGWTPLPSIRMPWEWRGDEACLPASPLSQLVRSAGASTIPG